jgi:hypothetical protein
MMRNYGLVVVLAAALSACGGNSTSYFAESGSSGASSGAGTSSSSGSTTQTFAMGNGTGTGFQSGVIGLSGSTLSAGGTDSLSISIVDQTDTLFTAAPVTISISSACISQGLATIAPSGATTAGTNADTFVTSTGIAELTYTAAGCSGPDVITASAVVGSEAVSATGTITVAPATVGSIQFISATPTTIGLKGTGLNETSTVVFKVLDQTGAARPGVNVAFTLNTSVGGITLTPATATSGNDGTVQTVVSSGTQHTAIRVTATISSPSLSTQSSQLTVTTGLPASEAFSIAVGPANYGNGGTGPACPNVEAYGTDGVIVPITVRLADRYNNPAPDGTAVAFNTNGGHIGGSCTTPSAPGAEDGTCTVNWTSANPRPQTSGDSPAELANGRAQILATAIGEESFTDVNGSGFYVQGDPFQDLGEPYRDDNENGVYDSGEFFLDFNNNGMRDPPDGVFKGITCSASNCTTTTLAIGVQHLLIMSGSVAAFTPPPTASGSFGGTVAGGLTIPVSGSGTINYSVADQNGNPMPAGTTVAVAADAAIGTIGASSATFTIGCRTGLTNATPPVLASPQEPLSAGFTAASAAGAGNITITVTTPGTKTATILQIPVTVN